MMRSILFVPAKEKMLNKISTLDADAYVVDLEDSIEISEKEATRKILCDFLKNSNLKNIKLFVRVNKDNYIKEIEELDSFHEIGFMLPKFESADDYIQGIDIFKKHENIALVETPKGIINIEKIVSCSWIDAIAFGAEDYTATMNMKNTTKNLIFPKAMLITYGKAYNKKVIDTPSFQLENIELFEEEVELAVDLGFDAKLAISPKHIEFINKSFSNHDIDSMQEIIKQYEQEGKAVLVVDGIVYERMHIARMKKIIKENGGKI